MELYGPNSNLLMRLMSATTERQRVLSNNIANQNTPGFKRRNVEFESLLTREMERFQPQVDRVQPESTIDTTSPSQPNGNNVNMELEVASMRENMLRYEMYATIMSGNVKIMSSAINGDR
ncbi:MAG: flagellar basal body rod protein FlgB [Planctomycetes bacterium]|nr:flagellar basal body rod protein FlgB [Planctomycetota bacterium]MCB9909975.1 flagellar basal body rod protein FlgB [Planctomycetota bacterium]HPF12709.1 flagellar basal body rod protein FlgB [Planctomycetota bacterium]